MDDPTGHLVVAQRIMRRENYMIAFVNGGLLDLALPRLPPRLWPLTLLTNHPANERPIFFSKSIEWSVYFCVLNYMFNHSRKVRPAFYCDSSSLSLHPSPAAQSARISSSWIANPQFTFSPSLNMLPTFGRRLLLSGFTVTKVHSTLPKRPTLEILRFTLMLAVLRMSSPSISLVRSFRSHMTAKIAGVSSRFLLRRGWSSLLLPKMVSMSLISRILRKPPSFSSMTHPLPLDNPQSPLSEKITKGSPNDRSNKLRALAGSWE